MAEGMWQPSTEHMAEEIAAYQGGFAEQTSRRWISALMIQTQAFFFWAAWRAGGLMLIGMALFKWGVLSAQRSDRFYATMAAVGFGLGLPIVWFGMVQHFAHDWRFEYSFFIGSQVNYWGSLFVAAGYIGTLMLAVRRLPRLAVWLPLSAAGRMAFTNYILQTVLCTFLFYGHGLGLFGQVERLEQALVVLGVWLLQLLVSPLWLGRYRFGPLEWLWRSLTYWQLQSFRRAV